MLNSSSAVVELQRRAQQRFTRHEHDHDVGRWLEVRPVALVGQANDVVFHLASVVPQLRVACRIVFAVVSVQKCAQRHLCVDDDVSSPGQPDDDVRCQPTVVAVDGFLQLEMAALEHACRFEHAAKLQLSPLAADVGGAQRACEAAGFQLECGLCRGERSKLFSESRVGSGPVTVDLLQLRVDLTERLLERQDEIVDGLLASGEIAGRRLLKLSQLFLCQVEEPLIVPGKRVGGERSEGVFQAFARPLHFGELIRGGPAFGFEQGLQASRATLGGERPGRRSET